MGRKRMEGWTALHFSQSDMDGDVPRLLRRVAKTIASLQPIRVQDITFTQELNPDPDGAPFVSTMTVYYRREDKDGGG